MRRWMCVACGKFARRPRQTNIDQFHVIFGRDEQIIFIGLFLINSSVIVWPSEIRQIRMWYSWILFIDCLWRRRSIFPMGFPLNAALAKPGECDTYNNLITCFDLIHLLNMRYRIHPSTQPSVSMVYGFMVERNLIAVLWIDRYGHISSYIDSEIDSGVGAVRVQSTCVQIYLKLPFCFENIVRFASRAFNRLFQECLISDAYVWKVIRSP